MDHNNTDKERGEIQRNRQEALQKLTGNSTLNDDTDSFEDFRAWYKQNRESDDIDFNSTQFVKDNYGRRMLYKPQVIDPMWASIREYRDSDSDEPNDTDMASEQPVNDCPDSPANKGTPRTFDDSVECSLKGRISQTVNNSPDPPENETSNSTKLGRSKAIRRLGRRDTDTSVKRSDSAVSIQMQLRNARLLVSLQNNTLVGERPTLFGPDAGTSRPPSRIRSVLCQRERVDLESRRFSSDETKVKRKIPTTFEEILGSSGIPTALLSDAEKKKREGV